MGIRGRVCSSSTSKRRLLEKKERLVDWVVREDWGMEDLEPREPWELREPRDPLESKEDLRRRW